MQERVKLTKTQVLSDIESGMSRKEIAEKYGLPATQMNKAISLMGLSGIRAKKVLFEIVEDEVENAVIPETREYNEEEVLEENRIMSFELND